MKVANRTALRRSVRIATLRKNVREACDNEASTSIVVARKNVLGFDDWIFQTITVTAQRSCDPVTQVGAAVVKNGRVISLGFNQMPNRCGSIEWNKPGKTRFVCCAERDAISNVDIKGCILYTSLFPCNMCATSIVHGGVKKVVYYSDKKAGTESTETSRRMFKTAKIPCRQYKPKKTKFSYDMDVINQS